jgi:hypothetical protein
MNSGSLAPQRAAAVGLVGMDPQSLAVLGGGLAVGVGLRLWWRPGRTVHYTELSRDGA